MNLVSPVSDSEPDSRALADEKEKQVRELLREIEKGSERAMEKLFRMFSRKVHAYVLYRCRDEATAEEIVIDTLHEVWKHPDRFRGDAKFSTWLIGIARHKMLDALRAASHVHEDTDDHADVVVDESPSAFDGIAAGQRRDGVQKCMEVLGDEQREALHLALYQDMPLDEVAAIQGVPENTVKTRLFHARKKMKDCLARVLAREQ